MIRKINIKFHDVRLQLLISSFRIINGRLVKSEDAKIDFHQFEEEKTLKVYIILPGISGNSVHVYVNDDKIKIQASILKEFQDIYRSQKIELQGKLLAEVMEGPIIASYNTGILKIELVFSDKS